jgi:dTDP-4-amino-4,6-dideoxygalactose transaminase
VNQEDEAVLPVMRPILPLADNLLPYLRRLDESRIYTNYGPLVREFEARIAVYLGLSSPSIATASSGTAALVGAILAAAGRAGRRRPFALLPSFTFVATSISAEQCGYRPYLADIDAETWMLDPHRLIDEPALERVGVVIPVAPFGRVVPQQPWLEFRDRTGIPVVIDGAASFTLPQHSFGAIPVAVSFHATKGFGTGEGGCVISTDAAVIERVMWSLNFGFRGNRDSCAPSVNGKMSEYHAAVGLAELDTWEQKRRAFLSVADNYRKAMKSAGFRDEFLATPEIGISYALFLCGSVVEADRVQDKLHQAHIESRLWYGTGLHHQTYYFSAPQENLQVTEDLAPRLVGIPMSLDLTPAQVEKVVRALASVRREIL